MDSMTDLDFLRAARIEEKFLKDLDDERPIYNLAFRYTFARRGGYVDDFTQEPETYLKNEIEEIKNHILREEGDIMDSKEKAEFDSLEYLYGIFDGKESGYFYEKKNQGTDFQASKIRISDLKDLYLFNQGIAQEKLICSKEIFFRSFVSQIMDSFIIRFRWPESNPVPSVEEILSSKGEIEDIFTNYNNIPLESLIYWKDPSDQYRFFKKTEKTIVPGNPEENSLKHRVYSIEGDSVIAGVYNGDLWKTKSYESFALPREFSYVPLEKSEELLEEKLMDLNKKHYSKDEESFKKELNKAKATLGLIPETLPF